MLANIKQAINSQGNSIERRKQKARLAREAGDDLFLPNDEL